ncbi:hypothetical protein [Streptomyces sp. NPDC047525]|uniref:hypothetical protein n=1 Tax=Streptomyces sp. NPDC047525 TaxID=3155264 RepID=UPI003411A558
MPGRRMGRSALTLSLPRKSTATTARIAFGAHRPDSIALEGRTRQGSWRELATAAPPASGPLNLALPKLRTDTYRLTVKAKEAGSQVTSLELRTS